MHKKSDQRQHLDIIDHAIRSKASPLYGLKKPQAERIVSFLDSHGFFAGP